VVRNTSSAGAVLLSLIAAAVTAIMIGMIAHDEMGMAVDAIRTHALSAAGLLFAAVSFGSLPKCKK
jgi:hypothetical protein